MLRALRPCADDFPRNKVRRTSFNGRLFFQLLLPDECDDGDGSLLNAIQSWQLVSDASGCSGRFLATEHINTAVTRATELSGSLFLSQRETSQPLNNRLTLFLKRRSLTLEDTDFFFLLISRTIFNVGN